VAAVLALLAAIVVLIAYATDPGRRARVRARPSAATPRLGSAPAARESLIERLRAGDMTFPESTRIEPRTVGLATLGVIAFAAVGMAAVHIVGTHFWSRIGSGGITTGAIPGSDTAKLEGRAVAIAGDMLRVGGKEILLDGVEAPEVGQSCERKGSAWRCGIAAKDALAGLVRGRRIACEIVGEADSGLKTARCSAAGSDLAEKLVRGGKVFATGGFMGRYSGAESDAADEKLGLWSGEPERPEDWRAKRWDEARRAAPDGCPIKGRIRSGARTYVLPWSPSYDSIELSPAKGERWFCSESEAQGAGWSRGSPS
jgi:endonuclease YncB( thermonuclease family)